MLKAKFNTKSVNNEQQYKQFVLLKLEIFYFLVKSTQDLVDINQKYFYFQNNINLFW